MNAPNRWRRRVALAAALLLLDISLTFANVWPTPIITWRGDLSVELLVVVLGVALAGPRLRSPSRRALAAATVSWMLLVLGRYANVTATALFGRDINLYWDLRFIPDVVALFVRVAAVWMVAGALLALGLVLAALWWILRWALLRLTTLGEDPPARWVLGGLAGILLLVFAFQPVRDYETPAVAFAAPVTPIYVRQARVALSALGGPTGVGPSPSMEGDLARVQGADVLLVFLESYGAITFDRPAFAEALAPGRTRLAGAIHETGRQVVSAFVESPTFGGSSWLAHISLMSGIEVRTPDTNAVLMSEQRDTLVTTFSRRGYRTVALMPGLWQPWPEGAFYGFDTIYGGPQLDYRGPTFGWFAIPDQYALARLDAVESAASGRPLFVFFPTISTHTPFHPTPPYQPDWPRMLTDHPYESGELDRIFARAPDWMNLGPSYMTAMSYAYDMLGGYLEKNASRDMVLVVLGDHQPPALVTGEGAPWDVPVHVIASRPEVLDRLREHGFIDGLTPERPGFGKMHTLLPTLLEAFSR